MSRPRTSRTEPARRRAEVLLALTHPRIAKLARKLKALEREGGEHSSDNRVAIGKLLGEAQASLEHGDWLMFVAERTSYTERSARRYMTVR